MDKIVPALNDARRRGACQERSCSSYTREVRAPRVLSIRKCTALTRSQACPTATSSQFASSPRNPVSDWHSRSERGLIYYKALGARAAPSHALRISHDPRHRLLVPLPSLPGLLSAVTTATTSSPASPSQLYRRSSTSSSLGPHLLRLQRCRLRLPVPRHDSQTSSMGNFSTDNNLSA